MNLPPATPLFFTLVGILAARAATSVATRWVGAVALAAAGVVIGIRMPETTTALAAGLLLAVLWNAFVVRGPGGSRTSRMLRPSLGLSLLAVTLIGQGLLIDVRWGDLSPDSVDGLLVLLLLEPTTRAVRLVLAWSGSPGREGNLVAGEMIGVLERLILFLLIAADGYAAVGFVIAAKGLVRYHEIEKDPAQAEYVLLGTLASVLAVLLAGAARVA